MGNEERRLEMIEKLMSFRQRNAISKFILEIIEHGLYNKLWFIRTLWNISKTANEYAQY